MSKSVVTVDEPQGGPAVPTKPKAAHIVFDAQACAIRCERCGASVGWTLPMNLDLFIALLHEAIRRHENCQAVINKSAD